MRILGDRHYKGASGESVTFSLAPGSTKVGGIAVVSSAGAVLPVTLSSGGSHETIVVTVGFVGHSGGSATIDVVGSKGGSDSSRIRQLTGLPNRSAIFIVD
jgi:hypothetical protein